MHAYLTIGARLVSKWVSHAGPPFPVLRRSQRAASGCASSSRRSGNSYGKLPHGGYATAPPAVGVGLDHLTSAATPISTAARAGCAECSETRASRDCPHIRELMPIGRSAAHQSFVRHSSVCARLLPRIRLRRIKRRADRELLFVTLPLACLCSHTTPGYKPARRYVLKSPKVRETLARKRSGLLLTSDRYVCEAAEIQGTGSRWREVEDTRLEVRASIINRDYD